MPHRSTKRTGYVPPRRASLRFRFPARKIRVLMSQRRVAARTIANICKNTGRGDEVNNSRASMNNFATLPGRWWRARHVSFDRERQTETRRNSDGNAEPERCVSIPRLPRAFVFLSLSTQRARSARERLRIAAIGPCTFAKIMCFHSRSSVAVRVIAFRCDFPLRRHTAGLF